MNKISNNPKNVVTIFYEIYKNLKGDLHESMYTYKR